MKPLFAVPIFLFATACVPGVGDYYKPSASGGKAINNHCGAFVAPQSTMQLKPHGIDVRVEGSSQFLYLQLRVPEGITVEVANPEVEVRNNETQYSVPITHFRYTNIEEKKDYSIPASEKLIGKDDTFLFGNVEPRIYSTGVDFSQAMGEVFSVLLPTVTINGKAYEFPAIQFNKGKGFGIYPINC